MAKTTMHLLLKMVRFYGPAGIDAYKTIVMLLFAAKK